MSGGWFGYAMGYVDAYDEIEAAIEEETDKTPDVGPGLEATPSKSGPTLHSKLNKLPF